LKSTMKEAANPVVFDPKAKQHDLKFDHVEYRYRQAEMPALSDIDFDAHSGQTIAIIGGTGSGRPLW